MKFPFKTKLELAFDLFGGSCSTRSDTGLSFPANDSDILPSTDSLDLEPQTEKEEIKPPELDNVDTDTPPTKNDIADKFLAAKAEEKDNPKTSSSDTFTPSSLDTRIPIVPEDVFSSSSSPSSKDSPFHLGNTKATAASLFRTDVDLSFLSLERPEQIDERIVDKVLNSTGENFVYNPDIIATRDRLEAAKKNGTLDQELAILSNTNTDQLSPEDQKYIESFNVLYEDASGYTGIKAASSVWEDIATKTTFYKAGSDTVISNTDPETGYKMFSDSFIPKGAPISEMGSLWRQDSSGQFIFYNKEQDNEYLVDSNGTRVDYTEGQRIYEAALGSKIDSKGQQEYQDFLVLKSKLTLAEENYDLETDAGKEKYRNDLAKHNNILKQIEDYENSQFSSFNSKIGELKESDPTKAQQILRAKESQDQRLRPVIADVFGAKDEETPEKLREQEQKLEEERRNATTPEERARLDQELKEVQEQRTRFEAWVKKHGGSDEDINAFQAKLEELRTSDPDKYKKIMAELNRLADLKDSDPDAYTKEIERLRETGLINETTGEIFAVLDRSRETVGSQKDQEDYKNFNVFVATNKEVAESRYARKFESVKEVLEFKGYDSIDDFLEQNGTATAEQEHFIKQNEFKYTPQKTNFQQEYYRQKYQSQVSTSQTQHRPSMKEQIASTQFDRENGLNPTAPGQASASFQAKVTTIMQLEGVPRDIAEKMAQGMPLEELTAYIEENHNSDAMLASLGLIQEIETYELNQGLNINNIDITYARNSGLRTPLAFNTDSFLGIQFG